MRMVGLALRDAPDMPDHVMLHIAGICESFHEVAIRKAKVVESVRQEGRQRCPQEVWQEGRKNEAASILLQRQFIELPDCVVAKVNAHDTELMKFSLVAS